MGHIGIGGNNPIRIQSMATTDTNDTTASVAQAKRIIDAGGELVRFTTQGTREAENMKNISAQLKADGYTQPLVADVHFTAHTADIAAQYCEKVRINPISNIPPKTMLRSYRKSRRNSSPSSRSVRNITQPFVSV